MQADDMRVMAWVDGELDAAARAEMEAAMRADPALAAAVAAQQVLRARVAQAHDAVLSEPVPAHLLALLGGPAARDPGDATRASAPVGASQTPARARSSTRRTRRWPLALAASLAVCTVAGVLGFRALQAPETGTSFAVEPGVASPPLAAALDGVLGDARDPATGLQVAMTFRDAGGHHCRVFRVEAIARAGLACRDGDGWMVTQVAPLAVDDGRIRQAASDLPGPVLEAVDATIDGDPLDAAAERAARARDWR